jgi:hypothetical protein
MATYSAAASAAVRIPSHSGVLVVCVLKLRPLAQTPDAAVYTSVVIAYPSFTSIYFFQIVMHT